MSPLEAEKRLKAIKKKLAQIAKLKERGGELDAEAMEKVASEAELLRETDCLERGVPFVPPARPAAVAPAAVPAEPPEGDEAQEEGDGRDPHAAARAEELQPAPADLGLLIDDGTEKRFKALQKKLRDIGKLWERDKLDKLQEKKLEEEPGLIEELAGIRAKAGALLAERRERAKAAASKPQPVAAKVLHQAAWTCPSCGVSGEPQDLNEDPSTCPSCGSDGLRHAQPPDDEEEEEEEADHGPADEKKKAALISNDLRTGRQKKAVEGGAKPAGGEHAWPPPASASWPEVKEVLESGECGVDRSRIKKAITVDHPNPADLYNTFDSTLLKCFFLTKIELRLPPGVLDHEAFQLFFPSAMADSLLELTLKGNSLSIMPQGLRDLQRIRSIDLSHNKISSLLDVDTWDSIAASLEMLNLSYNQLTSIEQLTPLTRLSALKVDANKLTSLDGISWGQQKQLVTLSAVGNEISDLPEAVGEVSSLEHIELSDNKITAIPTGLVELKKLKLFNVAGNPIKDKKAMANSEKGIKDLKAYLSKVGGGKKR